MLRRFRYFPAEMVQAGPRRTWVLHAPGAKITVVYTNPLIYLISQIYNDMYFNVYICLYTYIYTYLFIYVFIDVGIT